MPNPFLIISFLDFNQINNFSGQLQSTSTVFWHSAQNESRWKTSFGDRQFATGEPDPEHGLKLLGLPDDPSPRRLTSVVRGGQKLFPLLIIERTAIEAEAAVFPNPPPDTRALLPRL